jgi:hypothetical protein
MYATNEQLQFLKTDLLELGADLLGEAFPQVVMEASEDKESMVPELSKKKRKLDVFILFLFCGIVGSLLRRTLMTSCRFCIQA